MNINQKINEHPVIVIITVCIMITSAAVGVMKWFFDERINSIIAKHEAEIALLKKENESKNRNPEIKAQNDYSTQPIIKTIPLDQSAELQYGEIFRKDDPYPVGLDTAKIGTQLSILQAIYPSGSLDSQMYSVKLTSDPFRAIAYFYDKNGKDPEVKRIIFYSRDEKAEDYVRSQAISTFGAPYIHDLGIMGKSVEWRINEFEVAIYLGYSVRKHE